MSGCDAPARAFRASHGAIIEGADGARACARILLGAMVEPVILSDVDADRKVTPRELGQPKDAIDTALTAMMVLDVRLRSLAGHTELRMVCVSAVLFISLNPDCVTRCV